MDTGLALVNNPQYLSLYNPEFTESAIWVIHERDIGEQYLVESHRQTIQEAFYSGTLNSRQGLMEYQSFVEQMPNALGENPFPLFHTFTDGLYSREVHMPKNHLLVSQIHNYESQVHILEGKVLIADCNGTRLFDAPAKFVSKSGDKRAIFTLEDTIWINYHPITVKNEDEAEEMLYAKSYEDYDRFIERAN